MKNVDVLIVGAGSSGATAAWKCREQGLSVLLSEQNLHFATEVAGRAYIIEKGRIRYQGTMHDLAADETVRSTYLTV